MLAPCARETKKGSPPTLRKARTGEFTPPGMRVCAREKSSEECEVIAFGRKRPTSNIQRPTFNSEWRRGREYGRREPSRIDEARRVSSREASESIEPARERTHCCPRNPRALL